MPGSTKREQEVVSTNQKSVCIVISGHITCCPRMMKMAVALSEAGYAVTIVSPIYVASVQEADRRFLADPRWRGVPVEPEVVLMWQT